MYIVHLCSGQNKAYFITFFDRLDIFQGSPRALLFMDDPIESKQVWMRNKIIHAEAKCSSTLVCFILAQTQVVTEPKCNMTKS